MYQLVFVECLEVSFRTCICIGSSMKLFKFAVTISPKEKIKEMATMLARLSGGIVVNIHNVKTIIMFRGRNYRQLKNLIPINTLTKRKALFKARFEQALDSQKLNIMKIEQQLRRMNVNPDDPVAMASIQRVASTFFNPIDKKEGSPYVFHGDKDDKHRVAAIKEEEEEDSDQEELDKFIAEIEDAADKEWEVEEAAEKEEVNRIRYLYKEDYDEEDDDENAPGYVYEAPKLERWNGGRNGRFKGREGVEEESCCEDVLDELENVMFESDEENTNLYLKSSSYESESKVKTAKNISD